MVYIVRVFDFLFVSSIKKLFVGLFFGVIIISDFGVILLMVVLGIYVIK